MAKSMIDAPKKAKKTKPESGLQRRNSTGGAALIFSEPTPIPNYLRASTGSCHDLCKYGSRRHSSAEPAAVEQRRSTCTARAVISRNPPPRTTSSSKARRSKSVPPKKVPGPRPQKLLESSEGCKSVPPKKVPEPQPGKLLESSECCERSDQIVAEKIIHVVETNDHKRDEDVDDQNQTATSEFCPRKLEVKREGVVEAADVIGWKGIRLRRVVSQGDSDRKERECMRIDLLGKNKVKALVDTFETLMSTRDSEGSRACSNSL